VNELLAVALVTLLPGIELRGSIPLGVALGVNPLEVFVTAVSVNLVIIPVCFFAFDKLWFLIEKIGIAKKVIEKTRRKARPYVEKYGFWGLLFFVAIPLPGTGAYTGSLAAWVLGIKFEKALLPISLGVVIAGVLILLGSIGVLSIL